MSSSSEPSLGAWEYGIHPRAAGMRVRSLERVDLPLGEAVRLEMADESEAGDLVHLQYVIQTDAGPWALWIASPRADLAGAEAVLRELVPLSAREPFDQPPTTPRF